MSQSNLLINYIDLPKLPELTLAKLQLELCYGKYNYVYLVIKCIYEKSMNAPFYILLYG